MVKRDPQHQNLQKLRAVRSIQSIDLTKVVNEVRKLIVFSSEDKRLVALEKYRGTLRWYLPYVETLSRYRCVLHRRVGRAALCSYGSGGVTAVPREEMDDVDSVAAVTSA